MGHDRQLRRNSLVVICIWPSLTTLPNIFQTASFVVFQGMENLCRNFKNAEPPEPVKHPMIGWGAGAWIGATLCNNRPRAAITFAKVCGTPLVIKSLLLVGCVCDSNVDAFWHLPRESGGGAANGLTSYGWDFSNPRSLYMLVIKDRRSGRLELPHSEQALQQILTL